MEMKNGVLLMIMKLNLFNLHIMEKSEWMLFGDRDEFWLK